MSASVHFELTLEPTHARLLRQPLVALRGRLGQYQERGRDVADLVVAVHRVIAALPTWPGQSLRSIRLPRTTWESIESAIALVGDDLPAAHSLTVTALSLFARSLRAALADPTASTYRLFPAHAPDTPTEVLS